MRSFLARSIKQKLMILFTLTATVALSLACLAFWVYEAAAYRAALKREMTTLSRVLADSSVAVVAFEDLRAADETMASLRAEPRVESGCLQGRSRVLATYAPGGEGSWCPAGDSGESARFTLTRLYVSSPVVIDGEAIGFVRLSVSLSDLYIRLCVFGGIGAAVVILASLLALALASRLHHLISRPILHLTEVAERVSAGDYSLRAKAATRDEVGTLIRRFNGMMEQINSRDAALQQAQEELEHRVRMRTSELQAEIAERKAIELDLVKAKAVAEENSRAKSAFLANMSHELRTPLNAILGYCELLEGDAEDRGEESTLDDLRRIHAAGAHLLGMIGEILDFSKMEAGRMEVHMENVPVMELLQDVADTVEPLVRKSGNRLVIVPCTIEGAVVADIMKLRQSLLNLLSNACKFTENGTITVRVDREEHEGAQWICWRVRDTGIGIAPDDMGKLFRSFSQVDSSSTRKYGGTGLGLVISQRFCEMMGGRITVESDLGRGSTFTICIPAGKGTPSEALAGANSPLAKAL